MLPSIADILNNADANTQLGSQPRHPKDGKWQGMAHSSAKKGFDRGQSPERPNSSKGKGVDDPNHPAEEIEDEDAVIGQGDRPQVARNSRDMANKQRMHEEDEDEDEDDEDDEDEVRNVSPVDAPVKTDKNAEKLQSAGEAGQVKYESAKPSLRRAVQRVETAVDHPVKTVVDTSRLLYHHPKTGLQAIGKSIIHPIKHSADRGLPKPEEHKADYGEAASSSAFHFAGEPMFEDSPHDQTMRASTASMSYPPGREHAIGALDASMAGDSKTACKMHKKAARMHLKEAEEHMKGGDAEQAEAHFQAAHGHQVASGQHSAAMTQNKEGVRVPSPNQQNGTQGRDAVAINRKDIIDFIVANCDCSSTGGVQATRNTLNNQPDAYLLGAKRNLLGIITQNAKAEGSFADTKGSGGKGMMTGGKGHGAADDVTYEEEEDDDLDEEPEGAEGAFTGNSVTGNRRGPMTDEEWMAAAPPRIREIVRNSENRDNQEKMGLQRQIQLVANNQPPQKKQLILNKLQGIRSKQGLQELLALILPTQGPTENVSEEDEQIFAGAGAPMVGNTSNQANDDLLIPPTLNYDEEYEDSRNGKARSVRHSSTGR